MSLIVWQVEAALAQAVQPYPQMSPYCVVRIGQQALKTRPFETGGKALKWNDPLQFTLSREPYAKVEIRDKNYNIAEGHVNLARLYSVGHASEIAELWCNGVAAGRLQLVMEVQNIPAAGNGNSPGLPVPNKTAQPPVKPTEVPEKPKQIGTLGVNLTMPAQPKRGGNIPAKPENPNTYVRQVAYHLKVNYKAQQGHKHSLNPAFVNLPEGFDPLAVDLNSIYEIVSNSHVHQIQQQPTTPPEVPSPTIAQNPPPLPPPPTNPYNNANYPTLDSLNNIPAYQSPQGSIYPTFERPTTEKRVEKSARQQWEQLNNRQYPTLEEPSVKPLQALHKQQYPELTDEVRQRKQIFDNQHKYPDLQKDDYRSPRHQQPHEEVYPNRQYPDLPAKPEQALYPGAANYPGLEPKVYPPNTLTDNKAYTQGNRYMNPADPPTKKHDPPNNPQYPTSPYSPYSNTPLAQQNRQQYFQTAANQWPNPYQRTQPY